MKVTKTIASPDASSSLDIFHLASRIYEKEQSRRHDLNDDKCHRSFINNATHTLPYYEQPLCHLQSISSFFISMLWQ